MSNVRPKPWRVRVMRKVEAFVDVEATDAASAVVQAAYVPSVIHVFPESALPVELKKLIQDHTAVVED